MIAAWGSPASAQVRTVDDLVALSPAQLDALYAQAGPGGVPVGPVRGRVIAAPGQPWAEHASNGAKFIWQGKVFCPMDGSATNRFFFKQVVRGMVSYAPSWRDGRPSLIIDYTQTSHVYRNVRDEIREVAPGVYLGLMFDVQPEPRFTQYFAFQAGQW
jgi:hypothetical protein